MVLRISEMRMAPADAAMEKTNGVKSEDVLLESIYAKEAATKTKPSKNGDIYASMGVSLNSHSSFGTGVKEAVLPQETLKPTNNANILFDDTTQKYYKKDEAGNLVEMKPLNGGQIKMVNTDGSYSEVLMNSDGTSREISVGANGLNIRERILNAAGELVGSAVYKYENGKLLSKDGYDANGNFLSITDYDPVSGNKKQYTEFDKDGHSSLVEQYDTNTGNLVASNVSKNGKILFSYNYDPVTGNKLAVTKFNENEETVLIEQYDKDSGKLAANYLFENNVNTGIEYFDEVTGKKAQMIHFKDGANDYTIYYDKDTGKKTTYVEFDHSTGASSLINKYNPNNEKLLESQVFENGLNVETHYYDEASGAKIKSVYATDPQNGHTIHYDPETGHQVEYVHVHNGFNDYTIHYDKDTGKRSQASMFDESGNVIHFLQYSWKDGKLENILSNDERPYTIKELDNGNYVVKTGKGEYQLLDPDGNPQYACDKDGNQITE